MFAPTAALILGRIWLMVRRMTTYLQNVRSLRTTPTLHFNLPQISIMNIAATTGPSMTMKNSTPSQWILLTIWEVEKRTIRTRHLDGGLWFPPLLIAT